jgi:hypothetical protein
MYDLITSPNTIPFAISLAVVLGLFIIELISALLGGSILGLGADAPDIDADFDFDLTGEVDASVDTVEGIEADTSDGIFTWIGARDVPFLIWLVSFLTMFGLYGFILQSFLTGLIGLQLPASLASLVVFVPALATTRIVANWVALLMPKTESTAMKMRHLGGARGIITQGTAARGKPAEVKIKDRHDNIHYLRVEPLHDTDSFPQGSEVTVIRKRGDKFFVI